MPCVYETPEEYSRRTRQNLDRLTRYACEACRALKSLDALNKVSTEIRDWFAEHERIDEQRAEEARLRAAKIKARHSALSKLTPEEIEALDLKKDSF